MARLLRVCPAGIPQHVIQRGNNRQVCFAADEDFAAYAHGLHRASARFGVDVHAWVFMTNHVHLLATPREEGAISRMMQWVGRHYVRYFNKKYRRSGTLWEGRFKSCVVDTEAYLILCQRYIEQNPVRAGMVSDPADYRWSSYQSSGLGKASRLWKPHEVYLRLGRSRGERLASYRALFSTHMDDRALETIRAATQKGLALGSDRFKTHVATLTGRRVTPKKRGPKKHDDEPDVQAEEFLL